MAKGVDELRPSIRVLVSVVLLLVVTERRRVSATWASIEVDGSGLGRVCPVGWTFSVNLEEGGPARVGRLEQRRRSSEITQQFAAVVMVASLLSIALRLRLDSGATFALRVAILRLVQQARLVTFREAEAPAELVQRALERQAIVLQPARAAWARNKRCCCY